jgi:hypothetical protein
MAENDNTIRRSDGTIEFLGVSEEVTATARTAARPVSGYNIETFRNQNFIKSAKFSMQFTRVPAFAYSDIVSSLDFRKLTFLCDSVEFPGQTLLTTDYRIPGQLKTKIAYARDFNEVNFSFYINDEVPMYTIMSNWIYGISYTSTQNRYFDEIVGTIELTQFEDTTRSSASSPDAVRNMTVRLIDLYPLNLQSMPSNWGDDGYHKVNVGFCFKDLVVI